MGEAEVVAVPALVVEIITGALVLVVIELLELVSVLVLLSSGIEPLGDDCLASQTTLPETTECASLLMDVQSISSELEISSSPFTSSRLPKLGLSLLLAATGSRNGGIPLTC